MSAIAIKADELNFNYKNFNALANISFELEAGKLLALLGHNGAGKSTLIKLILGLMAPTSGQLNVFGEAPYLRRQRGALRIGYLPENVSFYDNMSGEDVLRYLAKLKGVGATRVNELLVEFQLDYAKSRPVRTYSKGMRQRLGLAQALLEQPNLLLLDEPTVGLDPLASAFLYDKVGQLTRAGCAVVICTHELSLIEPRLDQALIIGQGQMLAAGSLSTLRRHNQLPVRLHPLEVDIDGVTRVLQQPQFAALQPYWHGQYLQLPHAMDESLMSAMAQVSAHIVWREGELSLSDMFYHFMAKLPRFDDTAGLEIHACNR
ncbi:ABC transporter ATP-binding protein [Shewanella sp. NIFS-20-20]|uniref:ABC transporter ATP-binding protein n=1 Tax=Shewanella sp. NIFS-20-20 TaxID=2853806 RepID=UPI001C4970FC|nr:ABC transporter ATP-binding protein [Shewanella sp. NIFS-20-20]MBV7317463.1 ABC transporter ATP-binding protein [Shewanella sp. NIFS-20-20]